MVVVSARNEQGLPSRMALAEDQCQAAVRNLEIALSGTSAGFDTVLWAENGIHHDLMICARWKSGPLPDRIFEEGKNSRSPHER
jgi:hypothetical protein